ncbi:hypothetical protein [Cellulomonas oligotrophica]|uniref:Uncharacterized protein n=1 Tax=Cellulomonas oligotrophica TaxID=931536 RepID=A0A7Y9FCH1_9CELL|nr:hypothetical protein [Cellulomonas oligotrophica]NYD84791.1 hypothetical protein [Cellulomonas oligotrophica]GIG31859.1 hypothetical protein Col01nite_10180 [Cellulomonas oligotrophica]
MTAPAPVSAPSDRPAGTTPATAPPADGAPGGGDDLPVPVSAPMRHAKVRAFTEHTTVGQVRTTADGDVTIACACGMTLTNGPGWSLDEHIRLHRAEARFLALAAVAPAGIPRLVDWPLPAGGASGPGPGAGSTDGPGTR